MAVFKLFGLFGAIKALLFEGVWGIVGLAGIAAGLTLLVGDVGLIERVPLLGRWLGKARQAVGAVLIGAGAAALGIVAGFAHRGALEQAALLRLEKQQLERVLAAKAADLKSAQEIAEAWAKGAAEASDRASTAEAAILAYQQKVDAEEAANATKPATVGRNADRDRISGDDAKFLCGLAGRWAPGGCRATR